jgi:hypothetical protein
VDDQNKTTSFGVCAIPRRSASTLEGKMGLIARFSLCAPALALCIGTPVALGNTMTDACPESGVRIYVDGAGVITVNGHLVPAANLSAALASLRPKPTEVCYSRANAQGEPPPGAMEVMAAVVSLQLPVSFYTDGTFKTRVKLK